MAYINNTYRIRKFGGEIWYVSKGTGSDSNSGKTPDNAFETIGAGITACAVGDMITIMAGTYVETDINLNKNNVELHFEIGAIIQPASDTDPALTISGNYCWVGCHDGALLIDPHNDQQIGLLSSGNFNYFKDIRVKCDSAVEVGFDITGDGNDLRLCRCSSPLTAAFKIQGDKCKLSDCCTGGKTADTSIGYWITNSCDKFRLNTCGSQGHVSAGYQIDTGCTNGAIEDCYSGGGDGKWTDADSTTVWSKFSYDETLYKSLTLNNSHAYNVFKITGAIEIIEIFGHVTTELAGANTDVYFQLYSTNGTDTITKATDADMGAAVVGSLIYKSEDPGKALTFLSAGTPAVDKTSDPKKKGAILVSDIAADTYIRWICDGNNDTSGTIHFHIEWRPITDNGFVEVV